MFELSENSDNSGEQVDKTLGGWYIKYTITLQIKPMQPRWLKLHRKRAMVFGAADIYSKGGDASSEPGNVKESLKECDEYK